MTQEALKLALEALEVDAYVYNGEKSWKAITAIKEALAQTELCKYGQEPRSCTSNPMDCQCAIDAALAQTQEPPPWWPAVENILNEYGLQAIDFVADFKQALAQTQEPWCMKMNDCKTKCEDCPDEPPQRTERPVDCERCNRLEEHAYDLIGKLRVANIKLSMQPQRTWVDLTDEDVMGLCRTFMGQFDKTKFIKATEDKIKEKNT